MIILLLMNKMHWDLDDKRFFSVMNLKYLPPINYYHRVVLRQYRNIQANWTTVSYSWTNFLVLLYLYFIFSWTCATFVWSTQHIWVDHKIWHIVPFWSSVWSIPICIKTVNILKYKWFYTNIYNLCSHHRICHHPISETTS